MRTNAKSNWMVLALLSFAAVCVLSSCQGLGTGSTPQTAASAKTSAADGCPAPSSPGVRVCEPEFSASDSPVQVNASATASQGKIIQMQVFADGQKLAQAHGDRFDAPITLSLGTHTLTVVARQTGGSSRTSDPISLDISGSTAGQACPPPGSPGVNVCAPVVGSGCGANVCANPGFPVCTLEPWVTFVASATAQTGTIKEMQLWINGVDVANFPGNHVNTNLATDIFGTVTIVAVDSKGHSISSPAIPFEGGC
jgi:Bacterial Ig domain